MFYILRNFFVLVGAILFAGCASVETNKNSFSYYDDVKSAVIICAERLRSQFQEITPDFLTFDLHDLNYFIVVSEQDANISAKNVKYCHVDKQANRIVFASGIKPFLTDNADSKNYSQRYDKAFSGRLSMNNAKVTQFKLVNGIWRYIDSRDISRF